MNSIKVFIEVFEKKVPHTLVASVTPDEFRGRYSSGISEAVDKNFGDLPLDVDDKQLLERLAAQALCSDYLSDLRTGFVFAGYGRTQLFPALIAFESDGLIGDKIKRSRSECVEIDRSDTPAGIIPFAQREMVDRFLFAIDPEFEKAIGKT